MAIKFYHTGQQFDIFSNTTKIPVEMNLNGKSFHAHSTEAVFQGLKGLGITGRDKNAQAMIESEPRKLGGLRDWAKENDFNASGDAEIFNQPYAGKYTVKEEVMYQILLAKATQNPQICNALLDTGNENIIEDTSQASYDDSFWGNGLNGQGKNALGEAWMRVRTTLRDELTKDHQIRVRTGLSDDLADKLGHKGHIKNSQISPAYYTEANLGEIRAKSPATTVAAVQLNQFHPIQPSPGLGAHLAQAQQGHNALQQQMSPAPAAAGAAASTTMPKYGTKPATSVAITGPKPEDLRAALESRIKAGEKEIDQGEDIVVKVSNTNPNSYEIQKRIVKSEIKENKEVVEKLKTAAQKVTDLQGKVQDAGKKIEEEQKKFNDAKARYEDELKKHQDAEKIRKAAFDKDQDDKKKTIDAKNIAENEKWKASEADADAKEAAAKIEAAKAAAAAKSSTAIPLTADKAAAADLRTNPEQFVKDLSRLDSFIEAEKKKFKDLPEAQLNKHDPLKPRESDYQRKAEVSRVSHTVEKMMQYLNMPKNSGGVSRWEDTLPDGRISPERIARLTMIDLANLIKDYKRVSKKNAPQPSTPAPDPAPIQVPIAPTIPPPSVPIVRLPKPKSEEFKPEEFESNEFSGKPPTDEEIKKATALQQQHSEELKAAQAALSALEKGDPSVSTLRHKTIDSFGTISYNAANARVDIDFKSQKPNDVRDVIESVKNLPKEVVTIHNPNTSPALTVQLTIQALITLGKVPVFEPLLNKDQLKKLCETVKVEIEQHIIANKDYPDKVAEAQGKFNELLEGLPEHDRAGLPFPSTAAAPAATPVPDVPIELTASKPARPGSPS